MQTSLKRHCHLNKFSLRHIKNLNSMYKNLAARSLESAPSLWHLARFPGISRNKNIRVPSAGGRRRLWRAAHKMQGF